MEDIERAVQQQQGQIFAHRFLIETLLQMALLRENEPLRACDAIAKAMQAGFDAALTAPGRKSPGEMFNHAGLQEVETIFQETRDAMLARLSGEKILLDQAQTSPRHRRDTE